MRRPLYVAFTMDCERIAAESPPGGPETWELSERSIRSYCRSLLDRGIPPTLFLVPECAERHAGMLRELAAEGIDLGMHLHPQSFRDHRYDRYLGQYEEAEQRAMLIEARDRLAEAIGRQPTSFRSGNLSANEHTFPLVTELGFRQGSVSLPGRVSHEFAALWNGADPFPHWASAEDRLRAGRLPFFEVPITTNPYCTQPGGAPYELRIEFGPFDDWHLPTIDAALEKMETEAHPFAALCIFTHNFIDYADADDPRSATLAALISHVGRLRTRYDVVPVTLRAMRAHFVDRVGEPAWVA